MQSLRRPDLASRTKSLLHYVLAPLLGIGLYSFCDIRFGSLHYLAVHHLLWPLGVMVTLLIAMGAWGIWHRHNWARYMAMALHTATAVSALALIVKCIHMICRPDSVRSGYHGPPLMFAVWAFGAIVIAAFSMNIACICWFWRCKDGTRP